MNDLVIVKILTKKPYQIVIGSSIFYKIFTLTKKNHRVILFHQKISIQLAVYIQKYLTNGGIDIYRFEIPDAEIAKELSVVGFMWEALGRINISKSDCLISLGGGTVNDAVGFVSATWLRGIDIIHIPTTLIGMVDATIGGKTGINTSISKNLVGSFYQPAAVIVDLTLIKTLPHNLILDGIAEIVKIGFVIDPTILNLIDINSKKVDSIVSILPALIHRSVVAKSIVVAIDENDSHLRTSLNYGHTLAHAIERNEHYKWSHGKAVSVGLIFASELSRRSRSLDIYTWHRHHKILNSLGLPVNYCSSALTKLIYYMLSDKKIQSGALRFILLDSIAKPSILEKPEVHLLKSSYTEMSYK